MAYNVIAESHKKLDFVEIHNEIRRHLGKVEAFPMSGLGADGGDALGLCTPLKYADKHTWDDLQKIIKIVKAKFDCDVYDLYGGQKLNAFNLNFLKKNFLSE